MEEGITATIIPENTTIDEETGMTVLEVNLTLDTQLGVAKSNYMIESFEWCYRRCDTAKPLTSSKEVNKSVSVDVFREVTNYLDLVNSININ